MPSGDPPFLEHEPPPWLARGLATSVLVVAAVAVLASIVITVPETVTGSFVLVPARGTDPVRAPREGIVTRVFATDATPVRRGDTLFTVSSDPALDRAADRLSLEAAVAGAPAARADLAAQISSVHSADQAERRRLDARIATLERSIAAKRQQMDIARDLEQRAQQGLAKGVATATEVAELRLSASRTEDELSIARGDLEGAQASRARLDFDAAGREAELRERSRRIELEFRQGTARLEAMHAGASGGGAGLVVRSACNGTVVLSHVRAAGAVVQQGEALADVVCSGDSLVAEVKVPPSGVARVRAGQAVRLLYEAFPYQRHGVRFGEVTWVGAVSGAAAAGDSSAFRARVRLDEAGIRVDGEMRPLMPRMGGTARIVVARRRLVSYAFEPLRALREAAADRVGERRRR